MSLKKKAAYAYTPMGKCLRSGILCEVGTFLKVPKDALATWAGIIELFHAFTLVHDDIEDNDTMRRDKPTLWKKVGVAHGINTGDALLVALGGAVSNLANKNIFVVNAFWRACARVIEGQSLDFDLRSGKQFKKKYVAMCERKTGALFGFAFEAAALFAHKNKTVVQKYQNLGVTYGVLYQIADDIADAGSDRKKGKVTIATCCSAAQYTKLLTWYQRAYKQRLLECKIPTRLTKQLDKYVYSQDESGTIR